MTIIVATSRHLYVDSRAGWQETGLYSTISKIIKTNKTLTHGSFMVCTAGSTIYSMQVAYLIENAVKRFNTDFDISDLVLKASISSNQIVPTSMIVSPSGELYQFRLDGESKPIKLRAQIADPTEEEILFIDGSGADFFHAYYAMFKSVPIAIEKTAKHHPTCGLPIVAIPLTF